MTLQWPIQEEMKEQSKMTNNAVLRLAERFRASFPVVFISCLLLIANCSIITGSVANNLAMLGLTQHRTYVVFGV